MTPWLLPATGAFIGWLTNKLALALLFRPREPVAIGPWHLQGIIPSRRERLAAAIARAVQRDLLSEQQVAQLIAEIDLRGEVERAVERAIDQRIDARRIEGVPLVGRVSRRFYQELKRRVMAAVASRARDYQQRVAHRIATRVDVEALVRKRVEEMETAQVEALLLDLLRHEFRYLEWMGAILGGLIGALQLFFLR